MSLFIISYLSSTLFLRYCKAKYTSSLVIFKNFLKISTYTFSFNIELEWFFNSISIVTLIVSKFLVTSQTKHERFNNKNLDKLAVHFLLNCKEELRFKNINRKKCTNSTINTVF